MRIPFQKAIHGRVGGGLIMTGRPLRAARILRIPPAWDAPDTLDNSGYCTPLENQGQNPWCAAYAMCQLLQASYWRETGTKLQFDEAKCYAEAKRVDKIAGDGTSLEAVLAAAENVELNASGRIPLIEDDVIDEPGSIPFAIHQRGLVLCGLQITDGWTYPRMNGMIGDGWRALGGHAVLCSGYSIPDDEVWGPNWWGTSWGQRGFWRMKTRQFTDQFIYGYGARVTWAKTNGGRTT